MTYDQIIALLTALAVGEPDTTAFDKIIAGGYDPATPVVVSPCLHDVASTEIEGETIICGTVNVPENHADPSGRRIDRPFTVLKARSTYPDADPVVYLHGGPGGGTLHAMELVTRAFDKFRETRHIVTFDQRAAGLSTSVDCLDAVTTNIVDIATDNVGMIVQNEEGTSLPPALTACIQEFKASGAGVQHYNTLQNAYDTQAIMKALGYDTYNIYGISYGSRLALEVMRSAPEGVRAVIIDGVAPPTVKLYDTLVVPLEEAIDILIQECAADEACNTAYPELGQVLREVLDKATKGEITYQGEAMPLAGVLTPFAARNGQHDGQQSLTPYLPAFIYELHRGKETPTVDLIFGAGFEFSPPGPDQVRAAAAQLTDEEKRMVDITLAEAAALKETGGGIGLAVKQLKGMLRRDRDLGPLPALLDQEMSKYIRLTVTERDKARALLADYAGLRGAEASKEILAGFIERNFSGEGEARLLALLEAMTGHEIDVAFQLIGAEVSKHSSDFSGNLHLWIYACQEDVPYNSPEGFQAVNADLDWPEGKVFFTAVAAQFFLACDLFEKHPREGFHTPVVSDIPTLSIGSTWDIQTAPSWAALAAESLMNAQAFLIPEAGHGALVYQDCVAEMGVAFLNDPSRELDKSCPASAKPEFHIAPWVEAAN